MTEGGQDTRHAVIGAVTILCIIAFFMIGYSHHPGHQAGPGYRLYAVYDTATGLASGSPVLMAGIEVGNVQAMWIEKDSNSVQVEMRIREDIDIPIDSEAVIISNGIAGGKYIRIVPGGDYDMLLADDFFEYTRGAIDFLDLFRKIIIVAENRRKSGT